MTVVCEDGRRGIYRIMFRKYKTKREEYERKQPLTNGVCCIRTVICPFGYRLNIKNHRRRVRGVSRLNVEKPSNRSCATKLGNKRKKRVA